MYGTPLEYEAQCQVHSEMYAPTYIWALHMHWRIVSKARCNRQVHSTAYRVVQTVKKTHTQHSTTITHWGRVTHICIWKLTIIGLDDGLSPGRRQAILWTNAEILLILPLETNFSEIFIEIHTFSYSKMHLKMLSAKSRPLHLGPSVLKVYESAICWVYRPYIPWLNIDAFLYTLYWLRLLVVSVLFFLNWHIACDMKKCYSTCTAMIQLSEKYMRKHIYCNFVGCSLIVCRPQCNALRYEHHHWDAAQLMCLPPMWFTSLSILFA